MKQQIEIFSAGCPVCDPVVQLVYATADENCEVILYDMVEQCEEKTCSHKMKAYAINRLPSIVVDRSLLECCDRKITREDLVNAGIGHR